MTIQELNTQLTSLLKSYIKSKGYVSSGKLLSSIDFNSTEKANGGLDLKLNAQDYILYLEDGDLLNNFFDTRKVLDVIAQYEADRITRDVTIDL